MKKRKIKKKIKKIPLKTKASEKRQRLNLKNKTIALAV